MGSKAMEYQGPILVVAACIIIDDYVVLSQRADPDIVGEHPKLELPGGKVEFGEIPEEALQREIAEELNLEVRPLSLIPYIQTNIWEKRGVRKHYAIVCYECTPVQSDIAYLHHQLPSKAALVRVNDIDYEQTLRGTKEFIEHSSLLAHKREKVITCFIRLEPTERVKVRHPLAYIEIRILPSLLNDLGIYIVIKRKDPMARLQVPAPLRSFIHTTKHTKRPQVWTKVLNEEIAIQEFGRITNNLWKEGYDAMQFEGPDRLLDQVKELVYK